MTLDWLHFIELLGAIQGVILAGALASKRRNRTANRLLAVLMLSFSVFLATGVYHAARLEQRFPHFFGLGYPLPFLFGPLVYLYAISAADRSRTLTSRDSWHFVPFIVTVMLALPLYFSSGPAKLAFYQRLLTGSIPVDIRITTPLKFVSGVAYTIATLVFLLGHRERIKASYSSTERVNLRWLLWLGAGAASVWVMATVFQILEAAGIMRAQRSDDIVGLAIAVLVYGIGYMGLRQPEIFRFETAEYPVPTQLVAAPNRVEAAPAIEDAASRYERSGLTERQAERLKDALLALMDRDRPWQDSELTLADLAAKLDTTPHKLSEVLNSQLNQTFYDFVNGYRVREVQRRIAAGEARQRKILTLALDAGFASKSTFNTVFKKHTSLTPSDYRQVAGA